jgi:transcriptional regulator with XRE-family HTH domain
MSVPIDKLHKKWMEDEEYRAAYEALEPEFALAEELIAARGRAGLTQADVAARMGTTQSVVARIESGRNPPTLKTLEKYARAVGMRVSIKLLPGEQSPPSAA